MKDLGLPIDHSAAGSSRPIFPGSFGQPLPIAERQARVPARSARYAYACTAPERKRRARAKRRQRRADVSARAAGPRASSACPCATRAGACGGVEKALHREQRGRGCTAISVQDGGSEGPVIENDNRPAHAIQVVHVGRR